jgi:hypothetical protein
MREVDIGPRGASVTAIDRRRWLFAAALPALASAAALTVPDSERTIPSVVRDPVSDFVQPGLTVWWLVRGGPFRSASSSPGIAFAALTNAAVWLPVLWLAMVIARALGRVFAVKGK